VLVFGATGFTGALTVEALLGLGGVEVILAGRDPKKLAALSARHGGLETRLANADEPATLDTALAGVRVVIDTAGPFIRYGEPVVRAALSAGAHFLDTTGEQAYMNRISARYHGAAKDKRLVVVNAQAFEFALGYCAAALTAEWDPAIHTIDVFNRVAGFGTSRGTQKSALDALGEEALVRKGGRLVSRGPSPLPLWVRMPGSDRSEPAVPFPGGEALHLARVHPEVRNVTTNLVVPKSLAAPMMLGWSTRKLMRVLESTGALELWRRRIDRGPEGPSEEARKMARFKVLARGKSAVATRGVLVTGTDPYGITGVIAALGAKLLCQGEPLDTGVISTDQAFGAKAFLDALAPFGVAWEKHELSDHHQSSAEAW
jgi:short subunit dehydrogenase-like uncharacterized protein